MLFIFDIKKTYSVIIEIRNYFSLLSVIDKAKKMPEWEEYNLRVDWIGRIYTVVSLREEDLGDPEEIQKLKILQKIKLLNFFLTELKLQEILIPTIVRIENSRSWKVEYAPRFDFLTKMWVATNFVFLFGFLYELVKILISF